MEVGQSANRYEILEKLAEGGMAEIFLARSISGAGVERIVVLKRVLRHAAQDPQLVRLFVDEARLAAQLQHPNVVQVYDVGKLGSSYFFAMEYVHGETVRDLLLYARHHGVRLPVATVMTIAAGAAAGLHHAHDRRGLNGKPLNIVHSDVSPSNLMITREGVVKVVDFGIAKAAFHTADADRPVQGKLCYMAPEQVRSQPQDRRSDLFSLGIVMWELLTLQGLFRADSDFNVMDAIINEPSPPPSKLRPDVPHQVDEIVAKLLAKNPQNRYQSAAELLDALEAAAMRLGTLLSPSSMARQMREWFGDRDEPWIEQTVGGSVKRVVVDVEPVPSNFDKMTLSGPIDKMLDSLAPAQPRSPSVEGAPAWDNPTIENMEAMRDRLFRQVREGKTPPPEPDAFINDDSATILDDPGRTPVHHTSAPKAPPRPVFTPQTPRPPLMSNRTLQGQGPVHGSINVPPVPSTPPTRPVSAKVPSEPPATVRPWRLEEEKRSVVPMILLGIVITVGIGAGAFALLWKTQLGSGASRRDAGIGEPAPVDGGATLDTNGSAADGSHRQ